MWVYNQNNLQFLDVNEAAVVHYGYSREEFLQMRITDMALKAQAEREQLMRTVAQRIRQSLNLQDILNATVQEVRDLLGVDRVVVYQFDPEMIGTIVA